MSTNLSLEQGRFPAQCLWHFGKEDVADGLGSLSRYHSKDAVKLETDAENRLTSVALPSRRFVDIVHIALSHKIE